MELSRHQGISLSYLEQLFALLRKDNLVKGVRGPGGGYRLSVRSNDISIAQILSAINGFSREFDSEKPDDVIWQKFSNSLHRHLSTITLDSLVDGSAKETSNYDLDRRVTI